MKKLPPIRATAEQLPIISGNRLGIELIRGAAGSGKTSTAILRLRSLAYWLEERRERQGNTSPLKVLVLTFNRTLAGYVETLVDEQVDARENTEVTIDTFARWAQNHIGRRKIVCDHDRESMLRRLAQPIGFPSPDYLVREIDYLLGRFPHDRLEDYLTEERTGRGAQPRVVRSLRQRILKEIVEPYQGWLNEHDLWDWNEIALEMASSDSPLSYDIAVIDESQDFSANQLRAVRHHLAEESAITFVIDTMQRIYARGFTWSETGFDMRGAVYRSLQENHRNTKQIASFAAGILADMSVETDGTLPDLSAAKRTGPKPVVLKGQYNLQAAWSVNYIRDNVDLESETVAFLKPRGGGFFNYIEGSLNAAKIPWVSITRKREWPEGDENVALLTFHSAKGLEFDHVIILGLSHENTTHGDPDADDQLTVLRRLLAVAVARARKSVVIGYKPGEESRLVRFFVPDTYEVVDL